MSTLLSSSEHKNSSYQQPLLSETNMSKSLQGKIAIVTGAAKSNGVGFATAAVLAEQGANCQIVLHYNTNKDAALKSAEALKQFGVEVTTVQADASSVTFGKDIVDATLKAFPGKTIDIIVNNAAIMAGYPSLKDFPVEDFDVAFHTNVRSIFLLLQAAEPHLTAPGARIISISSVVATMGFSNANFYSGSKAALHGMTRGWAEEFGAKGITVNVVSFGPIETDLVLPEEHPLVPKFRTNQFVKRNGTTKEAAQAIAFLASPDSGYITGQIINVDGGMSFA
ncbi:putative 3-oxoacyl-(acyl-carrier-protein) reductase protein [Phaeoacremonium minimum UCRPA7]|uniref:Putative 3-oxoacyl-(Acyl-carrier-protein) reductase protein n=1 Tax=Phaeoacremonium minimum (strain UCR-PA7) TaxID=1286976 RepID=R8BSW0_PHAM7|nr:putative 3-oxoacyl-(acyl-carrier-protein) reductase protein [Phaeoacremonium minimum UCRPA7]EOO02488.1 putative 3-oxoacyl-(acyl-carrier-protein) reductase protein [Phaeoacremonium minimum UCRPA7]